METRKEEYFRLRGGKQSHGNISLRPVWWRAAPCCMFVVVFLSTPVWNVSSKFTQTLFWISWSSCCSVICLVWKMKTDKFAFLSRCYSVMLNLNKFSAKSFIFCLFNQTKTVIWPCRTQALLVKRCLGRLVCWCYCVTLVCFGNWHSVIFVKGVWQLWWEWFSDCVWFNKKGFYSLKKLRLCRGPRKIKWAPFINKQ